MRVVALEEHLTIHSLNAEQEANTVAKPGARSGASRAALLEDVENLRLPSMDEAGVTLQVLSVPGDGAWAFSPEAGPDFARRYNDGLVDIVRAHPDRFAAFAHLPMTNPGASADELERAVTQCGLLGALVSGQCNGKFLDDAVYEPLLARAEKLDVPLYIHPGVPPEAVQQAYYRGFSPQVSSMLATTGWGWHTETGIHVLRMVLAGSFDKFPKLKVIIGHMGEMLPTMLARCDDFIRQKDTGLPRSVSQTILDHVYITTSGFFTVPPFLAALLTFGADRILFSVGYPFSNNVVASKFLNSLPIAPDDRAKIAHGNADRLLKLG